MNFPDLAIGRARGGFLNKQKDEKAKKVLLHRLVSHGLLFLFGLNLVCPALWAQENQPPTRKRRVTEQVSSSEEYRPSSRYKSPSGYSKNQIEDPVPEIRKAPIENPIREPEIRIGLATNADFVSITCDGPMAKLESDETEPQEIGEYKVTVQLNTGETRRQRGRAYRVQVASFKEPTDAEAAARKLRNSFDEPVTTRFDKEEKRYVVSVGKFTSASEAQTMMVRVLNAGYHKPWVERDEDALSSSRKDTPRWQLRAVNKDGAEVARDTQKMTFLALEGNRAPLKYLNSAYRGKLEVFLNRRQRLTVVNVLSMEDYVRGVVPNELSPSGFPQVEALKAQAVAARTYAVRNRGQFSEEGFDLLPTALSQVYGGRSTEHPLTDRAVEETRGLVATYDGEPINALYTSTCGGRTENAEFVFGKPVPYLKSVATAPQGKIRRNDHWLESDRQSEVATDTEGHALTRELALLTVAGFSLPEKVTGSYLSSTVTQRECEQWADKLASLIQQKTARTPPRTATELGGFCHLVLQALYGNESPATLLNDEDARYFLGTETAAIPELYRLDVGYMVREGLVRPFSDGTFKARSPLSRATALMILARAAQARSIPRLESGIARPFDTEKLILKGGKGKEDTSYLLSPRLFLFRKLGGEWFPTPRAEVIGGETVSFHLDTRGRIDYLEVSPVMNGASSDHFSQFSWWDVRMTPQELREQLAKANLNVGEVLDLQPVSYGISHRVAQLRIVGSDRSPLVDGIHIRTVLGVRESRFVIERTLDERGKIKSFRIRGRGWGHGVGMCQVGAYGLALEGYTFDKILKHFYTGIQLTKMY